MAVPQAAASPVPAEDATNAPKRPRTSQDDDAVGGPTSVPPQALPPLKVTLYQLLIRQLQDDGLITEAQSISQHLHLQPDTRVDRDALVEAYGNSLKCAFGEESHGKWSSIGCTPVPPLSADEHVLDYSNPDSKSGLGATSNVGVLHDPMRRAPEVRVLYMAQHRHPCRTASFSQDGRFCATGCTDGSIRILDTARMRACVGLDGSLGRIRMEEELQKPVVRTLHDHVLGVSCLAFHPSNPTLFSGSLDKAVKIFDLTRPPSHKKAFSVLQDVYPVRCIDIHPCGDFLCAGTAHQAIRLYDLQTLNCFTGFHQDQHHGDGINDIRHSGDGRVLASASSDGSIHLWDAISHRIINHIPLAHSGAGVTSLRWSRNLHYLLSSGLDGRHRIWDVRQGSEIFAIGFGQRQCDFSTAVFAANEKYVVAVNSNFKVSDASLYDAQSGAPIFMKLGLHQSAVRALDASPTDGTFMTGCDDEKGRYLSIDDRTT